MLCGAGAGRISAITAVRSGYGLMAGAVVDHTAASGSGRQQDGAVRIRAGDLNGSGRYAWPCPGDLEVNHQRLAGGGGLRHV